MPVKIICPHCQRRLRLPNELYDQPVQCPICTGAFEAEWRSNPRSLDAASADYDPALDDPSERRPCPFCGKAIKQAANKCRYCKEWLQKPDEQGAVRM